MHGGFARGSVLFWLLFADGVDGACRYDACDEFGVIVYHDMQYAQQGHSPQKTETQALELRHQVRAWVAVVVGMRCDSARRT